MVASITPAPNGLHPRQASKLTCTLEWSCGSLVQLIYMLKIAFLHQKIDFNSMHMKTPLFLNPKMCRQCAGIH